METYEVRHAIVEQLPRFLQVRRRKWTGFQSLLDQSGLSRPEFSLLRALEGETEKGQGLTLSQMCEHLFNPYATQFEIFDFLPLLVERAYLRLEHEAYIVTDAGRLACNQIEIAARTYLSTLQLPSSISLSGVATTLVAVVQRSWKASEPVVKAHQARTRRRLSVDGEPEIVQIDWAILGLWEARDDAHMTAWRAYQFTGPVVDILSRVWNHEAHSRTRLLSLLSEEQQPSDVEDGIRELARRKYIVINGDIIEITPHGQSIRDAIEYETNRVFFAPWDDMSDDEITWLSEQIGLLCSYFEKLT